jgi:hypothetical protein
MAKKKKAGENKITSHDYHDLEAYIEEIAQVQIECVVCGDVETETLPEMSLVQLRRALQGLAKAGWKVANLPEMQTEGTVCPACVLRITAGESFVDEGG